MKQLTIILLGLIGIAYGQSSPTSAKTRFVNGIYLGTKLDSYFNTADSNAVYWRADSALMAKYKGTARRLAFAGGTDFVPYTGAVDNVNLGTFRLTARSVALDTLRATSSAGATIYSNSGTQVALLGAGGGAGTTLYGGLNGTIANFSTLRVSDSGIVRKLITSNTIYPSSLDTNKSFYWRVRDEVWLTDMPGAPNSGIAGLHIAKTDNSTNNPTGITWSTGSNNFKWDIGLDFENDDFVLGYNHDASFRGDFIRVSKTNRVNFGNGVGTPKFNTYKYKFTTTSADSTGIGGIQVSTTSVSDTALFVDGVLKGRNAKFAAMVQTDDVLQAGTGNGKAQTRTYFNNGDIAQFVNSALNASSTNYGFMQRNDGATFIGTTALDVNSSVTATSIIKSGGTSTQSLMADGSVQTVTSGTYTPTLTNLANVASSTMLSSQFLRVGNTVTVSGTFSITTTSNNALTEFELSLPVASDFSSGVSSLVGGTGMYYNRADGSATGIYIIPNTSATGKAIFGLKPTSGAGGGIPVTFSFTYRVL